MRHVLRDHGATFVEAKEQVDYYYHLPALAEDKGTRRLKLRVEGEKRELIYYRDPQEADTRVSQFQLWPIHDPLVIEVLDVALGNRVIVRKQRELWHKNNIRFNLDTVEDVGQILETPVAGNELNPQFQPWLKQAVGHLVLAHELDQKPMYLPRFVHVLPYHVVELLGIGCQIV